MMKLETSNRNDWQGFSRILEVMSFVDELEDSTPDQVRESVERLCELPMNPGETMSMEEVVFWAGMAAGIELWQKAEQEMLDPLTAEKIQVFASFFGYSTKNAIVDLALGQIEPQEQPVCEKSQSR
jgi:hypothetical protein